jgi:hypothetical protein
MASEAGYDAILNLYTSPAQLDHNSLWQTNSHKLWSRICHVQPDSKTDWWRHFRKSTPQVQEHLFIHVLWPNPLEPRPMPKQFVWPRYCSKPRVARSGWQALSSKHFIAWKYINRCRQVNQAEKNRNTRFAYATDICCMCTLQHKNFVSVSSCLPRLSRMSMPGQRGGVSQVMQARTDKLPLPQRLH